MPAKRPQEWFANEDFWRDLYPFMFSAERFAAAPEQMAKVLALTRPRGKRALDLCCGPGRCALALARAGYAVTGVDRTAYLLAKARAKARAAGLRIEWVHMDMRDFVRPAAFDLAVSMFTSFGYFDDRREDLQVLANLYASLNPGGVCLVDVMSKERLAKILQPITGDVLPDGSMLVQRHEIFDSWTRIRNEWTLIRRGRAKTFKFHHTVYSGQELQDRLEQAGFTGVELFGNLDGDPYGPNAQRLIAVARKPRLGAKRRRAAGVRG